MPTEIPQSECRESSLSSLNNAPDSTVSTYSTTVSRRRMAFRPPAVLETRMDSGLGPIATISSGHNYSTEVLPSTSTVASDSLEANEEDRLRKRVKMWSHEEIMSYYEGLKQYGKDFDGVMKIMTRRKVLKDKDQTKNFYFNSLKFLKQSISLNEDALGDITRDAKELFLVINACEWKKRTDGHRYIPDKMKELIFEGSTSIRVKKRTIVIKTPPCPSLLKFFTQHRLLDKFPPEIIISLKPMTYRDASYVVTCEQNPLIRIRVAANDRLSRIFHLLKQKWASPLERMATDGHGGVFKCYIELRIFPGKDTEVGRVVVSESEISPSVGISINKLKKEYELRRLLHTKRSSNLVTNTEPSYSVQIPNAFTLKETFLRDGLDVINVGDATVSELYCLCGMTTTIEMVYSINTARKHAEAWEILATILSRNYGESISEVTRKRERDEKVDEHIDDPPAKMRSALSRYSRPKYATQNDLNVPFKGVINQLNSQPHILPPVVPVLTESTIVQEENAAFIEQCRTLSGRRKTKNRLSTCSVVSSLSSTHSGITSISETLPTNVTTHTNIMMGKRGSYVSQYQARLAVELAKKQETKNNTTRAATDFSELCTDSVAYAFLSSLRTPEKTVDIQHSEAERERSDMMDRLFGGDLSLSPSRSVTSRIQLTDSRNSEDTRSRNDVMERLFGEVSLSQTPSKFANQDSSGLPDDVRQSVQDMMNQDSQDYVKLFEQLAHTMETPKK